MKKECSQIVIPRSWYRAEKNSQAQKYEKNTKKLRNPPPRAGPRKYDKDTEKYSPHRQNDRPARELATLLHLDQLDRNLAAQASPAYPKGACSLASYHGSRACKRISYQFHLILQSELLVELELDIFDPEIHEHGADRHPATHP